MPFWRAAADCYISAVARPFIAANAEDVDGCEAVAAAAADLEAFAESLSFASGEGERGVVVGTGVSGLGPRAPLWQGVERWHMLCCLLFARNPSFVPILWFSSCPCHLC